VLHLLYFIILNFYIIKTIKTCESIERHPYTKSRIDRIPCVCVYVCVCNYSPQTTEPICIKTIPANTASDLDLKYLPHHIYKPQKPISGGTIMLNEWEIHVADSCKAHLKINKKTFEVYGSNDVVQPKDGPLWG